MVPVSGVREEVEADGWVVLRGSSKVLRSAGGLDGWLVRWEEWDGG